MYTASRLVNRESAVTFPAGLLSIAAAEYCDPVGSRLSKVNALLALPFNHPFGWRIVQAFDDYRAARPICFSAFRHWSTSIALPDFHLLRPLLTSDMRSANLTACPVRQSTDGYRISRGTSWLFSTHNRRIYVMRLVTFGLRIVLHPRPRIPASYPPIRPPDPIYAVRSARVFDSGFLSAPLSRIQLPSSTLRRYLTGAGLTP